MTVSFTAPRLVGSSIARHLVEVYARRFLAKIELSPDGCWLWTGGILENGYGQTWVRDHSEQAHRVSYQLFVGFIPSGLQIDHLCEVKHCVNPDHLEAVTPRENTLRARARITHCPHGHPYDKENTGYDGTAQGGTQRVCLACGRIRARARRRRAAL